MIIEAGYDLFELFAPKLFGRRGSKTRRGTWVIAMDENLRNMHLTKVGGDASDAIENRIPKIVKGFYHDGPRYSFRDYVGYEHLPRTASILGPHEYPCDCLACTQHEEMLQRNRERHQAAQAETS
jgi:hypothetical protein